MEQSSRLKNQGVLGVDYEQIFCIIRPCDAHGINSLNRPNRLKKALERKKYGRQNVLLGGIEPPSTDSESAIIPLDHRRPVLFL